MRGKSTRLGVALTSLDKFPDLSANHDLAFRQIMLLQYCYTVVTMDLEKRCRWAMGVTTRDGA